MIKNIVFDVGNVLLTFEPEKYLKKYIIDKDKINLIAQVTFHSKDWLKLDRGEWSLKEAIENFSQKNPDFSETIEQAVKNWTEMLTPIPGTIEILKKVNRENYNIYALTNFPAEGFEMVFNHFSFWDNFDGIVVSAREGYIKPEKELYNILLERYNLNPAEILFIDDSEKNIEGARKAGMKGIVFTNPEILAKQLNESELLNFKI